MKKLNILFVNLLAFLLFFIGGSIVTVASTQNAGVGYSVQKISPEGAQVSEASSYYDLLVTPGETRTIQARIQNSEAEEISVHSDIFTTYTNANGEISYTSQPEKYDSSLKFKVSDFSTIVASDIDATIAPNSSEVVTVEIKIPDNIPDGVYLGSWYFLRDGQDETTSSSEGISINNMYSYAMAIKLTVNKEIEAPNMNLLNITTGLNNYRKVINANLQNDQAAVLSNLTVSAEVMKRGEYEVLYSNEISGLIMAPNSNYSFPVFYNDKPMEAGRYTMNVKATTTDPKWAEKTWEWTEDFTITENEVREYSSKAINDPEVEESNWTWLIILLIVILIILLLILLFVLYRRKKKKEEGQDR
ncbi:DUF916 and DUF3324 domain-containing protein [Enterococcus sp. AZ103]|uniref:DUF916 and DUF3324 domain-containing protein n=1 Tax=Enterococcus sp. AZ103 TaxID=2774628 RepID=UPI003F2448DB